MLYRVSCPGFPGISCDSKSLDAGGFYVFIYFANRGPLHLKFSTRLLLVVSLMLLAGRLQGQDASTGALRGTVFDPSGGQIAGATIVLVNAATGLRYSVTSDAEGRFALELLPPGDYSAPRRLPRCRHN